MSVVNIPDILRDLRFENTDQYLIWCRKKGYSLSLQKPTFQVDREIRVRTSEIAEKVLKTYKKISIEKAVLAMKSGTEIKGSVTNRLKELSKGNIEFLDFVHYLAKNSKLIENETYLEPIHGLWDEKSSWIRDYKEWEPSSHNIDKQFSSLSRFLLAKYKIPQFVDSVWTDPGCHYFRMWFIMIGQGFSVRDLPDMPFSLTKKQAHHFTQAPPNYTVKTAPYWAQIRSLDGNKYLSDALILSPFIRIKDVQFRDSLIKFFVDHPMLDTAQVGPILDYIWNQKYQNRRVFVERGRVEEQGPLQPNFVMTGRTPESLLSQVEKWHRQLGKEKKGHNLIWEHHKKIKDFEYIQGSEKNNTMRIIRITELLSSAELAEEGKNMRHCVASYSGSCHSGSCSIWSMTREDYDGIERLVTIEERHQEIVQIRGKLERNPTKQEMIYLGRWAQSNGLSFSRYLRT